jgi:hypothetical protein
VTSWHCVQNGGGHHEDKAAFCREKPEDNVSIVKERLLTGLSLSALRSRPHLLGTLHAAYCSRCTREREIKVTSLRLLFPE